MPAEDQFDPEQIGYVATLLETEEFTLFEDAFEDWFGKEPGEEVIEPYFKKYQSHAIVPFWVRSYIRSVLNDPDFLKEPGSSFSTKLALFFPLLVFFILLMYFLMRRN